MRYILYPFRWVYGQYCRLNLWIFVKCWYFYLRWVKHMGYNDAFDHMEKQSKKWDSENERQIKKWEREEP